MKEKELLIKIKDKLRSYNAMLKNIQLELEDDILEDIYTRLDELETTEKKKKKEIDETRNCY